MTNTMNNTTSTIIMDNSNTQILDAQGQVIMEPVTLEEVTEFVNDGKHQFTSFSSDGAKTRQAFVNEFGTNLSGITSMEAALKLSGLDFTVESDNVRYYTKVPGQPPRMQIVKDSKVLYRNDTKESLGIVSSKYQVLQNYEAFNFLDEIANQGGEFVNATLYRGARVMICMKTPNIDVLGDSFAPYIMFINSFDGTMALQAMYTPMRVFCANCINRAIKGSINRTMIRHTKNMVPRLEAAQQVMKDNSGYLAMFKQECEKLALMPVSEDKFLDFIKREFPIIEGGRESTNQRNEEAMALLMNCYYQDDLANFTGTAYQIIQAVSDFESRKPRYRTVKNPELANFDTIVEQGMPLLNKAWNYVSALA